MGDELQRKYRRVGDTSKCPACGISMDPDAYRCPKCRIYFCFKCRVRIPECESQFHCADQSCDCYGKLLCAACTIIIKQELPQTSHYETKTVGNAGIIEPLLITSAVVGGCALVVAPFAVAAGTAAAVLVGGGILMNKLGINVFSTEVHTQEEVADPIRYIEHRCCVACRHPVKHL